MAENIWFKNNCPATGGYWLGTVTPNARYNKKIMDINKLKTSHEYRQFLNKNSITFMKNALDESIKLNKCDKDPHGSVMISELATVNKPVKDMKLHSRCDYVADGERCQNGIPADSHLW